MHSSQYPTGAVARTRWLAPLAPASSAEKAVPATMRPFGCPTNHIGSRGPKEAPT